MLPENISDSLILEEEIDENYEPTQEGIRIFIYLLEII